MTAFLYESIFSGLSEYELVRIDEQVFKNREAVYIFARNIPSNVKGKTKKIIIVISLATSVWFSDLKSVEAIGMSIPFQHQQTVVIRRPDYNRLLRPLDPSNININLEKQPKIIMEKMSKPVEFYLPISIYLIDDRFTSTPEVRKLIKNLRGGSFSSAFVGLASLLVLYAIWQLGGGGAGAAAGFMHQGNPDPGWGLDKPNPFQPPSAPHRFPTYYDFFFPKKTLGSSGPGSTLQAMKPVNMPEEVFNNLTSEEKRGLPHINDMKIIYEGRLELTINYFQAKHKVGDHGAVHDLPYTVNAKNKTKTEKTDDNISSFMESIFNMPNRDNVRVFEKGTYQGNTDRGFEAIHFYDLDKRVINVFKKSTGKFVTTCQLDIDEHNELLSTGNFGGGKGWFSGRVKNLPPQQTAVNTFESDVMKITPISPMDENSSPNTDFTPTSSFESDVMSISPINNFPIDNP